jgi:hypothetical protein
VGPFPERLVNLDGVTYEFEVSRHGESLTLSKSAEKTPMLVDAYARLKPFGFEILGIDNGDNLHAVREYIEKRGVAWRQILQEEDGPILKLYRVRSYPTYYLVDENGTIIKACSGWTCVESELSRILNPTSPVQ